MARAVGIEAIARCPDVGIAYVVVSEGGIAGVGEQRGAFHPAGLRQSDDGVTCRLSGEKLTLGPMLGGIS